MQKYPKPNILLVDIEDSISDTLISKGYNISTGSFGSPYKVPQSDQYQQVHINENLPVNTTEQEIVIIDLHHNHIFSEPTGDVNGHPSEPSIWASCKDGQIDPRPLSMLGVLSSFDRILTHGGVFIIFSDQKQEIDYTVAKIDRGMLSRGQKREFNNWSFLSILESRNLSINNDFGREVVPTKDDLGDSWKEFLDDGFFRCTFKPTYNLHGYWFPIAKNKYDEDICALIVPRPNTKQGLVILLPQLYNKEPILTALLEEMLPRVVSHLFPFLEKVRWIDNPLYDMPKVLEIKKQIDVVREESEQRITQLESQMQLEYESQKYLADLITETGQVLIDAVIKSLQVLGFQSVIDMDSENVDDTKLKREDLQIRDSSPLILVEVKGVKGGGKESNVLQILKYLAPRMKALNRTDIHGLSIINHQRYIPPLEREQPFTPDIVTNAEEHEFGLFTTWNLYRLVRNFIKYDWSHNQIRYLFYEKVGIIEPIPRHYILIGTIENFWEKHQAVGVRLQNESLTLGDRIAFELPIEFIEQVIDSLQHENQPVDSVSTSQLAGIQTIFTKEQMKKGIKVFRVSS